MSSIRPPDGTGRALGDDDYRNILAFRDRLRRFLHWSDSQARAAGLTPAQHQMLLAVRGHPGAAPTIGEISEHLQLQHHSTVGLIDRAEAAGLVRRQTDAQDGRVTHVRLTPSGQAVLEHLTALHLAELRSLAQAGPFPDVPSQG